ncbi:MAG: DNA polymerase III subunit gamma/tau [Thermodesulfobacteriota bacterium]|nr:DNA polymerase III subunit gamma/tau [Thermodesulfobacteriota bacterium]
MSYLVLARKWRPRLFEEVIGQRHVTKTLINAITSNRVAHAFLFAGSKGVGKTSVARILSKALNCQEGPTPRPCNRCESCKDISAGVSMDVLEIDGASNTGVDDIRDLREKVRYLPSKTRYKVYIIDEVHMLSNSAFNALLKTLEEPPGHIVFVFATTEPHKIPLTILSRCQRYDFKRILTGDIVSQLRRIALDEQVSIDDKSLALIAREAQGSMRDAQSILDQAISYAGKDIGYDHIVEILGIIDRKIFYKTSLSIIKRDPQACLDTIEDIYNYGYDIKEFYKGLLEHFRNLVVVKVSENPSKLMELPENEITDLREQGALVGVDEIQYLFRILANNEDQIIKSTTPKLIMEVTLVSMAHTKPLLSIYDILHKIDTIEKRLINLHENEGDDLDIQVEKSQSLNPPSKRSASNTLKSIYKADDKRKVIKEPFVEYSNVKEAWQELIGFIRKKRPLLASIVEIGSPKHVNNEKIDIGFEENSIYLDKLKEAQNKRDLVDLCREFFQTEVAVHISKTTPDTETASISQTGDKKKNKEKNRRYEALNNEMVKDAIRIFGGTITEIKTS